MCLIPGALLQSLFYIADMATGVKNAQFPITLLRGSSRALRQPLQLPRSEASAVLAHSDSGSLTMAAASDDVLSSFSPPRQPPSPSFHDCNGGMATFCPVATHSGRRAAAHWIQCCVNDSGAAVMLTVLNYQGTLK